MPVFQLDDRIWLPRPDLAEEGGLLACGGDLQPERLLLGYGHGIFPWPHEGLPLLWFSPDPREVLRLERLHLPRSLRKTLRRGHFTVTFDTAFDQVIEGCARVTRRGQSGTWLTGEMKEAYRTLHRLGYAHSAETWCQGRLAGGLYGVSLGGAFFGESMFAEETDASKVAFVLLAAQLRDWGFTFVDCQVRTEHMMRFGSESWPRAEFLGLLAEAMAIPTRVGPWTLSP